MRTASPIRVRLLAQSDIPFADSLRAIAGWNQTLEDWNRFLELDPASCFVVEWEGVPAGTAVVTSYGKQVAWIGMVLVHPDFRRRGIGRFLVEHCLAHLRARGVRCVKLDASSLGKPLYENLGFREEWGLNCWVHAEPEMAPRPRTQARECRESDLDQIISLDAKVFGTVRGDLLRLLFQQSAVRMVFEGAGKLAAFGFMRRGSQANHIGPAAALDAEAGEHVLSALLWHAKGRTFAWVPDLNEPAVAWAKANGFSPQRVLTRMYLRENAAAADPRLCYAIAGPDLG